MMGSGFNIARVERGLAELFAVQEYENAGDVAGDRSDGMRRRRVRGRGFALQRRAGIPGGEGVDAGATAGGGSMNAEGGERARR